MFYRRQGHGPDLLLVHGLGADSRSWSTITGSLAAERTVIAVDLPGHGRSPALGGDKSVARLADELEDFIGREQLGDVDLVGSSLGGRLVLELVRRGHRGSVVALDPGGFWNRAGARRVRVTLRLSLRLLRGLRRRLPALCRSSLGRAALLSPLSARPWKLEPRVALSELQSLLATADLDEVLTELVDGPAQEGLVLDPERRPVVIGWGRQDRLTRPRQASCATERFPGARLHWFDRCGHLPHLDRPEETARLILDSTDGASGHRRTRHDSPAR